MLDGVTIGEAARQSGVKVPTIRYYEQIGLLSAPARSDGNRRQYEAGELRRLAFIRHSRELGFDIEAIRTLLTLQDNPLQPCATADAIAGAVSLDMAAFWMPTVRSYFGRVSKARILEAVREAVSDEAAERTADMKKQPMAEAAEQLLAGTGWLPALLRMPAVAGRTEQHGAAQAEPCPVAAE